MNRVLDAPRDGEPGWPAESAEHSPPPGIVWPRKVIDVVTIGETMALMRSVAPGPLSHAASLELGIGGAESNVAIALRRLGASVAWIGRVGSDSLGDLVLRELRAEDLQLSAVRDGTAPTGLMIKERRTADAVNVMYYRAGSAGSRLSPEDIPTDLIIGAKLLHVTGITPALSASAADAIHYAVARAREAGTLVSFDLNYRSALWSSAEASIAFQALIAKADVVFAGDDEAAIAVGECTGPDTLARRIAGLGPSQVIIKRGAAGATALVDGELFTQPAVPIRPVDTVGAGDAFVAGYLAELLRAEPVAQRLVTAVRTGAFACLVPGDWEGMPRRSELAMLEATEQVFR
ncbi:sugar kinase [Arthrobacter dokdonensis]|uniref:sugar kinase n=1 Tax=Arthrobacter dokdonellae TaxID=2211210 RepID=UPI001D131B11|nr:sugar kinase [Arthrobacter dokdonellae]